MSEDIPVPGSTGFEAAGHNQTATMERVNPFTRQEFAEYLDYMKASIGSPDWDQDAKAVQRAVVAGLEGALDAHKDDATSPDDIVKERMEGVWGMPRPTSPTEARIYDGQRELLLELWDTMGRADNLANMRGELAEYRANPAFAVMTAKELVEGYSPGGKRKTGGMDDDAVGAARRLIDSINVTSGVFPSAPTSTEKGGMDEAAIERARQQMAEINVSGGTPAKAETASAHNPVSIPEILAPKRGNEGSAEDMVTGARQVLDAFYARYGRRPLTPAEASARLDTIAVPYAGDLAERVREIKAYAITPGESQARRRASDVLAPFARTGNQAARELHRNLASIDDYTSIMLEGPDRLQEFLTLAGFRPERVAHYVSAYQTEMAESGGKKKRIVISMQRDPSAPDPADGKILDEPMYMVR